MRSRIRAVLAVLLLAPTLVTCGGGGTEPGTPHPKGIHAGSVQTSIADRTAFAPVVTAQLVDASGDPVAVAGVEISVAPSSAGMVLVGPTVAVTDGDGLATFAGLGARGLAGNYVLRFDGAGLGQGSTPLIALTAGAPFFAAHAVPDSLPVGASVSSGVVSLTDSSGNKVAGVSVTFALLEGNGSTTTGTVTDGQGRAFLSGWHLDTVPGNNRLQVTFPTAPALAPIEVAVRAHAGPPKRMSWSFTLPDTIRILDTLPAPVTVTVSDTFGNRLAGRNVSFQHPVGAGLLGVLTDSNGQATLPSLAIGTVAGAYAFRASVTAPGGTVLRDTNFAVLPGAAAGIDAPWVPFADRIPGAVRNGLAAVRDAYGNPRPGETLSFHVTGGGGSVTPASQVSDSSGHVAYAWTLGTSGAQTLAVTSPALPADSVALSGVVLAPTDIQVIAGDSQTGVVGSLMPVAPKFRAVDSAGVGVPGVPLQVFVNDEMVTTVSTDSLGYTEFQLPHFRTVAGPWTYSLISPWVPGDTARIHLVSLPGPGHHFTVSQRLGTTEVGQSNSDPAYFRLVDFYGNATAGTWVLFHAAAGSLAADSALTDSIGLVHAPAWTAPTTTGLVTLTATRPESTWVANSSVDLPVSPGPIDSLVLLPGPAPEGFANEPLAIGVRVGGWDQYGNPAVGRGVTHQAFQGDATATGGTVILDSAGQALMTGWTLGAGPTANLQVDGGPVSLGILATVRPASPFTIQLRNVPPAYQQVFRAAAYQWRRRITADVPDVTVNIAAGQCAGFQGALSGSVDDLVIDVSIGPIDGPGAILGGASPCFIRSSDSIPILGVMQFDDADLQMLTAQGTIGDVILHEMGHVLGIGSLWNFEGLLIVPGTSNVQYLGTGGKLGYANLGGGAGNVPVENTGGQGTADSHWRETTMPSELMTGYLSALVNPMSEITVRSLVDLGYTVDASSADPYVLGAAPPIEPGHAVGVRINDRVGRPMFTVDPSGKIHPIQ